jgi:16S rRNA (cytosine1402-N4)-methyltransferase
MTAKTYHEPVMLAESIEALNINPDGIYVDVTYGGGGHSNAILERLGPKGRLIAFDQDADAQANLFRDSRLTLVRHNFRYLRNFLRYYNAYPIDGLLADLGISSHQIDEPSRGFSIRFDADLDMRMNTESSLTARDILNTYPEESLVEIFSSYGEVFNARTLAKKISESRRRKRFESINEFRETISPLADRQHESQYYAKVFQALRIEVNDELGALKEMLMQTVSVMKPGGRLVVIAYHSLEDRIVKNFITKGKFEGEIEKDLFGNTIDSPFKALSKKAIEANETEISANPRARSAKMRVAGRN